MQIATLLAVFLLGPENNERLDVPVVAGSMPPAESVRGNLCNLAVVRGLRPSRHLIVRSGTGVNYRKIGRLSEGERIYTCNERGEWIGVVFSRSGSPCGGPSAHGLDVRKTSTCRSGWVHRNWIEIVSG